MTKGRQRFNIKSPEIKLGNYANISLFLPNQKYIVEKSNIKSKKDKYKASDKEKDEYGKFIIENNDNFIVINKPSGKQRWLLRSQYRVPPV